MKTGAVAVGFIKNPDRLWDSLSPPSPMLNGYRTNSCILCTRGERNCQISQFSGYQNVNLGAGIAHSVYILSKGWMVRGSNPRGGEIFRTRPDRPWGPHSLLYIGYRIFPGGKATGTWR